MTVHKFIDLFSGCGGLSLGLTQAGLQGQFAIEKDSMAFQTFSDNFLGDRELPITKFAWPTWLKQQAWGIDNLLAEHSSELLEMQGKVDVLGGGPPCQGFSFAGRRQESDPRNMLFEKYVHVVDLIKPSALVLENVPGMKVAHSTENCTEKGCNQASMSFYERLKESLQAIGYVVEGRILDASRFGVPQKRSRLVVMGLRKGLAEKLEGGIDRLFDLLEEKRIEQLADLGLPEAICSKHAISDLRSDLIPLKPCNDPYSPPGFHEATYSGPESHYQRLMHSYCKNDEMDSMRLARHREDVRNRFAAILRECARGITMNKLDRDKYGLKKHRIHPMSEDGPAPTITTLPDDILHYAEARILTVRESARLQSFPDWFRFRGKFTTGGDRRTKECPRYTQVGNAVPPLLGRAIGLAIVAALEKANSASTRQIDTPQVSIQQELTTMA